MAKGFAVPHPNQRAMTKTFKFKIPFLESCDSNSTNNDGIKD